MENLEDIIIVFCDMSFSEMILYIFKIFGMSVATFSLIYFALWGITQCVKIFKNISN